MTKFAEAVYASGKSIAELSREYSNRHGITRESAYRQGNNYYNNGVKYYKSTSINWAELLGKSFIEIQEDKK